jgi:membrane associated rhomboid family serine protease
MLPIGDDNSSRTIVPVVTFSLIVVNALVFFYQLSHGDHFNSFVQAYGVVPYEITHGVDVGARGPEPVYLTLLTSMFMHANLMHFGGNMLFLYIFGDNVEDAMGHWGFLAFYLICGFAADAAQIVVGPDSTIPGIGASGAIAGVMGAYLLLFPHQTVRTLTRFGIVHVSAFWMLGIWIVTQVLSGVGSFGGRELGGVAYFAHIGGFVAGLMLARVFATRQYAAPAPQWRNAPYYR